MKLSTAATAMIVSATLLSFPAEVAAKRNKNKFEAEEKLNMLEKKMQKEFKTVNEKMDEIQRMIFQLLEQNQSVNPASKASKQGKGGSHGASTSKASKNAKAANFGYGLSRSENFSMSIEPTVSPTVSPTAEPTFLPTAEPTFETTTAEPTFETTTAEPTFEPTLFPTAEPIVGPIPTYSPTAAT